MTNKLLEEVAEAIELDITEKLVQHCNGYPHAKIKWPHRVLHEAKEEIVGLRKHNQELVDALEESQMHLHHAWNRIHCLPRTTDTVLANNIDRQMAANRMLLAIQKKRGE